MARPIVPLYAVLGTGHVIPDSVVDVFRAVEIEHVVRARVPVDFGDPPTAISNRKFSVSKTAWARVASPSKESTVRQAAARNWRVVMAASLLVGKPRC